VEEKVREAKDKRKKFWKEKTKREETEEDPPK